MEKYKIAEMPRKFNKFQTFKSISDEAFASSSKLSSTQEVHSFFSIFHHVFNVFRHENDSFCVHKHYRHRIKTDDSSVHVCRNAVYHLNTSIYLCKFSCARKTQTSKQFFEVGEVKTKFERI